MDQIRNGLGTARERKGVPCPDCLLELQLAERSNWQILPSGLVKGSADEQPIMCFYYWLRVMSLDAELTSRFRYYQQIEDQKKAEAKAKSRGRRH